MRMHMNEPHRKKEHVDISDIQPSFRPLGQMQVKWQKFDKPENRIQFFFFGRKR